MLLTRLSWKGAFSHLNRSNSLKNHAGVLSLLPDSQAARPRSCLHFSEHLRLPACQPCRNSSSRTDDTQSTKAKVTGGIQLVKKRGKGGGYCYGCGADLVKGGTDDTSNDIRMETVVKKKGFWASKKDDLRKSKISNWTLCPRCKKLQKITKTSSQLAESELANLGPNHDMTQVFRDEVSRIRGKEKAVVVLCVDAVNISGSLIKTIRNYVGGNPILLAVTRCDLLPQYVWTRYESDLESLKTVFRQRARELSPAAVYLCSEEANYRKTTGGLKELTQDLWDHLDGRDPYVVGAANIGKSTLTDILIARLARKGEKSDHFGDRMSKKRLEALQKSRITRSSLPGTTLQNVRVPVFQDHHQALWDTPGLLLDESFSHFPIRNLRAIRAQRPSQIQPQVLETTNKAFCLLICEKGDDLPLMRIEIRLKKSAEGEGPVRLVWNSILNLDASIVDIATALADEHKRMEKVAAEKEYRKHQEQKRAEELAELTREEREKMKIQRKEEFDQKVEQEKARLGAREWKRLERAKQDDFTEKKRIKDMSRLTEVHQVVLERGVGVDLAVPNFGWLGVLVPRTTLIKSYAPSSGVRVSRHPTLGLPIEFGDYSAEDPHEKTENDINSQESDGGPSQNTDPEDEDHSDFDEEMFDDWQYGAFDDFDDDWAYDSVEPYSMTEPAEDRASFSELGDGEKNDPWAKYSGENVGWQFDADQRFMKSDLEEGWNPLQKKTTDALELERGRKPSLPRRKKAA